MMQALQDSLVATAQGLPVTLGVWLAAVALGMAGGFLVGALRFFAPWPLALPLAVAVFRISSTVANLAVCIYVAYLYGIALTPGVLFAGSVTALAISVGTVGLPGQVSFFASIAPIALAMGLPLEVLPLLLAVEVVPDIFRTIGNVTADLAAARIVEGRDAAAEPEAAART